MTSCSAPPSPENAAIEARRVALLRFEWAAGAAFGCDDDTVTPSSTRLLTVPTTIALATMATAFAATITYLV